MATTLLYFKEHSFALVDKGDSVLLWNKVCFIGSLSRVTDTVVHKLSVKY